MMNLRQVCRQRPQLTSTRVGALLFVRKFGSKDCKCAELAGD